MGVQNWCHNYRWGGCEPMEESCPAGTLLNIVFPAKTSLLSSSSCTMYHVEVGLHSKMPAMVPPAKQFTIASFLAQCGDIESNPGPKAKKEAKPDPKKIMEDKVMYFYTFGNFVTVLLSFPE